MACSASTSPRGTDLTIDTANRLAMVAADLNSRPRKTLAWESPFQRLDRLTAPTYGPAFCDDRQNSPYFLMATDTHELFEALHASQRLRLPFRGVLAVGY